MTQHWQTLDARFPPRAVRFLRDRFETPGSFSMTARDLARESGTSENEAQALLDALAAEGALAKQTYVRCANCDRDVSGDGSGEQCRECGTSFAAEPPVSEVRYQAERDAPRDVSWVFVLHGMNTRGTWQEELTWLIARSYKRMVPVAIYKYGMIRPGVLFRWRQRMILQRVISKFVMLSKQARDAGLHGPPDVIAHSFGTWLIAHALSDPRIRVGRVILLGSIVRPDFPWSSFVDKRVDRVLNHGADKDFWVRVAQFAIPDSGPGGTVGYPSPVLNVAAKGLGHSDYFDPETRMRSLFNDVWKPFLSWQTNPPLLETVEAPPWRPSPLLVRLMMRILLIGTFMLIAAGIIAILAHGIWCLAR